jgi:BR serine/threonine kinase
MRLLDHPHMLKLIDVLDGARHLHLVLEYAENGELFDYLVKERSLQEDDALDIFRQMMYALDYLHTHSVCHRDLKPENILLDANRQVRIADFGFARWMRDKIADTSCGSPHYAAPEVIRGQRYDGCAADIWSAGVILYALLAGCLPFDDPSIRNLLAKVKRGKFAMPDFHPDLKDLISKMICVDPEARIKMAQVKQHPAFKMMLPASYIVPSPIPLERITGPIELETVRADVKESLERLGIGAEELKNSLAASDSNMVKIFVTMLTRKTQLEELPWSEGLKSVDHLDSIETVGFGGGTINQRNLRPVRRYSFGEMSPVGFSLPTKQEWIPLETDLEFDGSETISPCFSSLPSLMARMQGAMTQFGFTIFHPNDQELIGRNAANGYFRILATYLTRESLAVELQLKNLLTEGTTVCDRVRELAQQSPITMS